MPNIYPVQPEMIYLLMVAISPEMAGFGFDLKIESNHSCVVYYIRIIWRGEIVPGQGKLLTEIRL